MSRIPHSAVCPVVCRAVAVAFVLASLAACGPSQAKIAANVKSQLAADPATSTSRIEVAMDNGVAHLSGEAETRAAEDRAVTVARGVPGVKDVVNELRLADAALVQEVKAALAADPMVGKIPIRVESTQGAVRLYSDQTNQTERTRIDQIARAVPSVLSVEDDMK
jgi:osmotically-inducible protein OsmY